MSANRTNGALKPTLMQRPPLPVGHANPLIATLDPVKIPPVKFQEIVREGQTTVVARVKIPTPAGHAFILRRLDTGAVSLTTMFRTAFPTASEDAERKEASWVKSTYDTSGANKSGKARFAGTWVTPEVACEISKDYNLEVVIRPLADAVPDPTIIYRKSSRNLQQPTPVASPAHTTLAETPSREAHPAKRRREASPVLSPAAGVPAVATPARRAKTPQRINILSPPGSRRSARVRSPAPVAIPATAASTPKTPKTVEAVHEHLTSVHVGSDETAVEEEDIEVVKVARPSMEEDIQDQKELIERLKAQREVENASSEATLVENPAQKRIREDDESEYKLDIKDHESEERALVSNSRVRKQMAPERKSLAWGALAFAVGMGAVQFLPSLPSFF